MTNSEFSNEFDVLYNNIMSNQAPGLDEYEKSVFLTKAQDEIVKNYFNPNGNKYNEGFDSSLKRQYDFSSLIVTDKLSLLSQDEIDYIGGITSIFPSGLLFKSPSDVFFSLNERLIDDSNRNYTIVPITYTEYNRIASKPYPYPLKRQAWKFITNSYKGYENIGIIRMPSEVEETDDYIVKLTNVCDKIINLNIYILNTGSSTGTVSIKETNDNKLDISFFVKSGHAREFWEKWWIDKTPLSNGKTLGDYLDPNNSWPNDSSRPLAETTISTSINPLGGNVSLYEIYGRFIGTPSYIIRYVKTLSPIILVDLNTINESLSIKGKSTITECLLPEETHSEILQRAVELAKAAYIGDINSQIQMGQRSE